MLSLSQQLNKKLSPQEISTDKLTINEDLIVNGTSTTINSHNMGIKDNLITINNGETGNGVSSGTAGIKIDRGTEKAYYIAFQEKSKMFQVGAEDDLVNIASHEYVQKLLDEKMIQYCGEIGKVEFAHWLMPGFVKANGAIVLRAEYPRLWEAVEKSGVVCTEREWSDGKQGLYSSGDENATFRLPDLRGQFLRGLDDGRGIDIGRVLGTYQGDAIRNITGTVCGYGAGGVTNPISITGDGAFKPRWANIYMANDGNSYAYVPHGAILDASRVVPTATENRPYNIALIEQIKY